MLISSLVSVDKHSTHDLDATVQGFPLTHETIKKAFREIIAVDADDDFSFEFVRTEDISFAATQGVLLRDVYGLSTYTVVDHQGDG